jgi:hypothetical protein
MNRKEKIDNNTDETNPQLFGSLMYLANTRIDSCHTMNGPSHFMSQTETDSLDDRKSCIYEAQWDMA